MLKAIFSRYSQISFASQKFKDIRMLYSFSTTATYHKNNSDEWVIYNWLNTSYAILNDTTHPLYIFLENNKNNNIHSISVHDKKLF